MVKGFLQSKFNELEVNCDFARPHVRIRDREAQEGRAILVDKQPEARLGGRG